MYKYLNYPIFSTNFTNLTMGSGVVLIQDRKILLVRENNSIPYSFPGGTIEEGESIEQTAIRETQEELGLNVTLKGAPFIHSFVRYSESLDAELVVLFHFAVSKVEGKLKLGTDAKEMIWKPINDNFGDSYPNVFDAFSYFLEKYGSDTGYKIE